MNKDCFSANKLRAYFLLALFFILYFIIGLRLYFIQIKNHNFYIELAEKQYSLKILKFSNRGLIYDSEDRLLACNKKNISAFIFIKICKNLNKILEFLSINFPEAAQRFDSSKNFFFIKRNLSDNEFELLKNSNFKEIHFLETDARFYPYQCLNSVIGFTNVDNLGVCGLEKKYDRLLSGKPSNFLFKKDAQKNNFYFYEKIIEEGETSCSLKLTIAADLQFQIQSLLEHYIKKIGAREGAVLVFNPNNGAILSMISAYNFDFNNNLDVKEEALEKTRNLVVAASFEAGSVLKVFATLAALEEKVVALDEIIDCESKLETFLDGIKVRTPHACGKITFKRIIECSNNIGIVKVMKRLGVVLYNYYKLFGFGELTKAKLPGEEKGFVNHPSNWSKYSIQSLSYGYEIRVNLLQLAVAFSTIFNNGFLVLPRLIEAEKVFSHGPIISLETQNKMKEILKDSVRFGTGRKARIKNCTVYGKTGTANIFEHGEYQQAHKYYSFMGCVQKADFSSVICLYIKDSEKKSYASVIAAPLFKKIAKLVLRKYKIK